MRCDRCVLERDGGEGLPIDAFLEKLGTCTECPLLDGGDWLGARLREAARLVRNLSSKVRQHQNEIRELTGEMERAEARVEKLESLHRTSTRELEAQIELALLQEAAIRAMSTPIIRVWEGVLALPVIGPLDRARAELILGSLLAAIVEKGSTHAILDLTGVGEIDEATADHLLRISRAAELLGARVILTGLHGRVAQALVAIDVDLSSITTMGNVKDAIQTCMRERRR